MNDSTSRLEPVDEYTANECNTKLSQININKNYSFLIYYSHGNTTKGSGIPSPDHE